MAIAIGNGICFATVAFLSKQFRRHRWTDLYENLTYDVYRSAIEHYEEIFGIGPEQNLGPENGVENYKGFPTSSQNLINFGPLTAKNRNGVFTHPPKILRFSLLPGYNILQAYFCFSSTVKLNRECRCSTTQLPNTSHSHCYTLRTLMFPGECFTSEFCEVSVSIHRQWEDYKTNAFLVYLEPRRCVWWQTFWFFL